MTIREGGTYHITRVGELDAAATRTGAFTLREERKALHFESQVYRL